VTGNTNSELLETSLSGSQLTLLYAVNVHGTSEITVRATDLAGAWAEDTFTVTVDPASSGVVGRHIFYNNSSMDAGGDDDAAIDPGKTPLLPGGTATSANYTSYSRGINGIMVDIDGLAGVPTTSDIGVRVNEATEPDTWSAGPIPTVSVRPGEGIGGSDRVTLIWADDAILNQWVEVSVLSDANGGSLGLAENDVFYLGNAIGDCDGNGEAGSSDYGMLADEFGQRGGIGALAADLNGNGRVDLTDLAIMRGVRGNSVLAPTVPTAAPERSPAVRTVALQAAGESIAATATAVVLIVSQLLTDRDVNDDSIAITASVPAVDLLVESLSPDNCIPEPQAISIGPPATTLYRAPTAENDLRTLGDSLPVVSAHGCGSGLDISISIDDSLADILSESPVTIPL
jgi:hypothetical protein